MTTLNLDKVSNQVCPLADKNNIEYVIGIARNSRLEAKAGHLMEEAICQFEITGEKQ